MSAESLIQVGGASTAEGAAGAEEATTLQPFAGLVSLPGASTDAVVCTDDGCWVPDQPA